MKTSILKGKIVDRADLFTYDLEKLGNHFNVDYIVTFENVR